MKQIVDIVNFNADASCLSSRCWLGILQGGNNSWLSKWLKLYVNAGKKVVLGFPGATIADISSHNPESINLINSNPDVFEIIHRPFAHDISLLRQGHGFALNVKYGRKVIEKEFENISAYFLPPEFMLTNEQVSQLSELGISGVFINSSRFPTEVKGKIPSFPYTIRGLFGVELPCIPIRGDLTNHYLNALQMFDCSGWNTCVRDLNEEIVFTWRDGESSFLLPDGLNREAFWLHNEDIFAIRSHIKDCDMYFVPNEQLSELHYCSYPVHSFSAWMKEFRMLGFINRIQKNEDGLYRLTPQMVHYWLMCINSDIMSAIEKRSPVVCLKPFPNSDDVFDFVIQRSERGFEGEEYLAILEKASANDHQTEYLALSKSPHIIKWRDRIKCLNELYFDEPICANTNKH